MLQAYKIASAQITSEAIDGEVMILNLDNGNYYNLTGCGIEVWNLLEPGASPARMVAELSAQYRSEPGLIESSVGELLENLEREGLIRSHPMPHLDGDLRVSSLNGTKPLFTKPVLTKYTDMQDLLLLDPIHEVDPSGWPRAMKK